MWMDRQTKNGQTNGQNYTNFERNLAMMAMYVPSCLSFQFDLESGSENVDRRTDRWTSDTSI